MADDGKVEEGRGQRSKARKVDLGLRVIVPVGFAVLTAFNVISLIHEGPATPKADTSPAQQVKLATVGEIGSSGSAQLTLRTAAAQHPDLYLALGDLSDLGVGSEPRWCSMVRSYIGPVAPFELVAGRSEEDGSNAGRLDALAACLPDRMNSSGQYAAQYSFDLGKLARVIVISPDLTINGSYYYYTKGSAEYKWLADAIQGARTAGNQWVIVAMNDDCISAGQYYCDINPDLLSLLITDHVDLVLSAHDHSYQRSAQVEAPRPGCPQVKADAYNPHCVDNRSSSNLRRHGGTVFMVVGSATSSLYPINESSPVARYLEASMGENREPRRGFLMLTITRSKLSGKFVPSSPGAFVDKFSIDAAASRHTAASDGRKATTGSGASQ